MCSYSLSSVYDTIITTGKFIEILYETESEKLTSKYIEENFPNNPPLLKSYLINYLKINENLEKEDILNYLKPIIINWTNPRNGTYVRENKKYKNPKDKYILKVILLLDKNIFVKFDY